MDIINIFNIKRVTIRYIESWWDYRHRPEFLIHFRDYCMKNNNPPNSTIKMEIETHPQNNSAKSFLALPSLPPTLSVGFYVFQYEIPHSAECLKYNNSIKTKKRERYRHPLLSDLHQCEWLPKEQCISQKSIYYAIPLCDSVKRSASIFSSTTSHRYSDIWLWLKGRFDIVQNYRIERSLLSAEKTFGNQLRQLILISTLAICEARQNSLRP